MSSNMSSCVLNYVLRVLKRVLITCPETCPACVPQCIRTNESAKNPHQYCTIDFFIKLLSWFLQNSWDSIDQKSFSPTDWFFWTSTRIHRTCAIRRQRPSESGSERTLGFSREVTRQLPEVLIATVSQTHSLTNLIMQERVPISSKPSDDCHSDRLQPDLVTNEVCLISVCMQDRLISWLIFWSGRREELGTKTANYVFPLSGL